MESSPEVQPPLDPAPPLCLFYFSHPFRIAGVEELPQPEQPSRRRLLRERWSRDVEDAGASNQCGRGRQLAYRRKRQRVYWRRYLRRPIHHLTSYLLIHNTDLQRRSDIPDLAEVLRTVKQAWASPRSCSLDRAKETRKLHLVEEPNVPTGIGTGQRMSHAGAHPSQHSSPLPHRRYSVPETVMRRYTLTKQRSDSSDSGGVATVPVVTPEAISSDHSNGSKNILEVGKRHGEGDSEDRRRDSPSSNRQNRHRNELFPDKDLVNDKKSSLEHSTSKDSDKNQKRMLEKFNISRSNKIARQLSQDSIDKCFHRRYSEQLTGGSWNRNSLSLIGRSCIFRRRTSYPQARESSAAAALQSSSSTKIQEFKLKMPAIMLEGSSSNYYQTKSDNTLSTQDMTVSIISDLASERNESSLIDGKIISMDYFENEQLSPSATEDNLSVTKPSRKESLGAKFEILSSPTLYPTKSDHTISTQDLTVSLTSELTNGDKNGDSEIDKTSNSKITPNRHFGVEIENLKMLSGSSTTLYPNNSDHTFSTQDATLSLISGLTLIDNEALVGESKEDENYDCTCHPVNTSAFGSTPTMDEDFRKEAPRASVGGMSSPTMYPDKSDHTISTQDMTLSLRSESAANQSDQVGDTAKTSSRELNELFRENPSTSENTTFRSNDSRIDTSEIKSNFESSPSFYKTTSDHTISTQDMTLSLRSDSAFTQSEISLANDEIVLPKSSKVIGELHECNKDETPGTDGRLSRRNVLSENKNDPTSDEKDYVLNQDQAEAKEFLNQNEKKLEESQIISQRSNGSGKSYIVKKLSLDEPSQSYSSSPDTGGNNSESRSGQSSGYNESPSGQTSETSTDVSACTPTECIVTTPESDQTHNMSTSSDRISESCSITPVGNSSGSSRPSTTPEGIEIQIKSLENSSTLGQTVSDHTSSTQDMTLSLRSESVVTHNTPDNESGKSSELTAFSDLVQDIEHISFMEDKKEEMIESNVGSIFSVLNVKDKPTNVMPDDVTTRSTQTSAQGTNQMLDVKLCGDSNCKLTKCFKENKDDHKMANKLENILDKDHKIDDGCMPSRSCAIIKQTSTILCVNEAPRSTYHVMSLLNKQTSAQSDVLKPNNCSSNNHNLSLLPSKFQVVEFCGTKSHPVGPLEFDKGTNFEFIDPKMCYTRSVNTLQNNNEICDTKVNEARQIIYSHHDSDCLRLKDRDNILSPILSQTAYNWSHVTDETRCLRTQHQRQHFWANQGSVSENISGEQGPLSSCIGTGSVYRKNVDAELVVPRYSALPRSMSMLVNTSSGDCSSNSNSDSECLSLVDSLEESFSPNHKKRVASAHQCTKVVRADIVDLLPVEKNEHKHKLIYMVTPRGRAKAFFVSISGKDDSGKEIPIKPNTISQSMPEKLKKKLSERYHELEVKKIKKQNSKELGESSNDEKKRVTSKYQRKTLSRTKTPNNRGVKLSPTLKEKQSNIPDDQDSKVAKKKEKHVIESKFSSSGEQSLKPQDTNHVISHKESIPPPIKEKELGKSIQGENPHGVKTAGEDTNTFNKNFREASTSPMSPKCGLNENIVNSNSLNEVNLMHTTNTQPLIKKREEDNFNVEEICTQCHTKEKVEAPIIMDKNNTETIQGLNKRTYEMDAHTISTNSQSDQSCHKNGAADGKRATEHKTYLSLEPIVPNQNGFTNQSKQSIDTNSSSSCPNQVLNVNKSQIPIMKSPIVQYKLSKEQTNFPIGSQLNSNSTKSSNLPIRRPTRPLQQSAPTRRSANILANRFQRRFEVIPEEKSGSLESSTEDQNRLVADQSRRASLTIEKIENSVKQDENDINNAFNAIYVDSKTNQIKKSRRKSTGNSINVTNFEFNKTSQSERNINNDNLYQSNNKENNTLNDNKIKEDFYVDEIRKRKSIKTEDNIIRKTKGIKQKSEIQRTSTDGDLNYSEQHLLDDESNSSNDKQVNNNGGGRDSRRSSLKRKTLPKRTVHQTKAVESLSRQGLDYVNATTQDKFVQLDQIEALPPDQYGSTPVEQSKIVPLEISKCYQGRASLMPQAEERDLLSLSKGWINFYLIKENLSTPDESNVEDGSCNTSDKEERRQKLAPLPKTVSVVGGGENRIRQCTVPYRPTPTDDDLATHSPNTALPELLPATRRQSLVPPADRGPLTLPKTPSTPDSDHSTTYLQISGSPRLGISNVLEGSGELACSESSVSSSGDSEDDRDGSPAMYPLRWPVRARRSSRPHRTRSRTQNYHQSEATPYQYQQPQQAGGTGSGWTVTVAGTTTFPQDHHDVEMRLSFPACSRRHTASQSDSGVGEDTNNNGGHHGESQSHFLPPAQMNNTQHWSLTVKNQTGGFDKKQGEAKNGKKLYQCLPDLTLHTDQRPDTGLPVTSVVDEETLKVRAQRRLSLASWPKVHKIVQNKVIIRKASGNVSQEVRSVSHLLEDESGHLVLKSGLTITGSAITPEKKPRVPTMSERDVTRMHTTK